MSTHLLAQASQLAQAGIAVFPTGADKRPAIKGWRQAATTDPAQLAEWFSGRFAGIGVPCGPDQDLICFDVDLGHTDDAARIEKLQDWLSEWANVQDDGYVLRKTRSGGYHLLFGWPHEAKTKVPRRIMPKMDVIIEGFYFVWDTEAGDYTHVRGEFDDMVEAPAAMCKVIESSTGGDGSSMMSAEEAHEVMMSDGDAGMRHDALLRMTHDWAHDFPDMKKAEAIRLFEEQFRDYYGDCLDPDRLDEMFAGETSEVARAMVGAYKRAPVGDDLLERAAEKLRAKGRLSVAGAVQVKQAEARAEKQEQAASAYIDIDLGELEKRSLKDIDWIVDDMLPAGNLVSVTGPSGVGKTRFVALLMAALSTGDTDRIGLPKAARPIRSLFISNEERTEDVERRLKAAKRLNQLGDDKMLTVRAKEHGRFALIRAGELDEDEIATLVDEVNKRNIELVIIDPIVTIGIEDENSAAQVDVAMEALQSVAAKTGACVMYIHHSPKDRTAPEDALRGDSAAWRGSGVFFSSLDLGLTLMPWLPEECHDRVKGKDARRRWKHMVRNHQAPKYVVMDSAKERENEGLGTVMFEIIGQMVNEAGRKIGAMRPVPEAQAQAEATRLLAAAPEIDTAVAKGWAEVVLAHFKTDGKHKTTFNELAKLFDAAKPRGWPSDRSKLEKLRTDRGTGKAIMQHLGAPQKVAGNWVSITEAERGLWCHVSKVS